jgi:hypothetical protein
MFLGCGDEEPIGQTPTESTPPGVISNVTFQSIPGGAIISYTPPSDTDFAYVNAYYQVNANLTRNAKSSKYTQEIVVDGFENTDSQTVTLTAVDYNGNESAPIEVEVVPDTPPYISVFESLQARDDFGGVLMTWENPLKKFMGITVLNTDETGELVPFEVHYDEHINFAYNVRNLEAEEQTLGFFVRDEFGNVSDTLVGTFKPLFETELDKTQWRALALDTDIPVSTERGGISLEKAFDGEILKIWTLNYLSTRISGQAYLPHHQTYDLGEENLLSRFIMHPVRNWAYREGGVKTLELYGTNDQSLIDREYNGSWVWTNPSRNSEEGLDGWTYLGEFEFIKPSGLPGTQVEGGRNGSDNTFAHGGFEFNMPPNTPSVRYLRVRVTETWDNTAYASYSEITLFGAPTN